MSLKWSALQLVQLYDVIAQHLAQGCRPQLERRNFPNRPFEVEHREIGAEDHLVGTVSIDVVHKALRPVGRTVRITSDVDILVLPGHRDHLVGPGDADVNADELELRKVTRDAIERNRTAD